MSSLCDMSIPLPPYKLATPPAGMVMMPVSSTISPLTLVGSWTRLRCGVVQLNILSSVILRAEEVPSGAVAEECGHQCPGEH